MTLRLLIINVYGYAARGETYAVFCLQKTRPFLFIESRVLDNNMYYKASRKNYWLVLLMTMRLEITKHVDLVIMNMIKLINMIVCNFVGYKIIYYTFSYENT